MYVKKNLMLWAASVALAIPLMLAGSALATGIDGGYVGSDACLTCHDGGTATNKTSFKKSGHPYKLRSTKGLAPVATGGDDIATITDPLSFLQLMNTPLCTDINALTLGDGCRDWPNTGDNATSYFVANGQGKLDWSGVQYVVGGFHAKFRWAIKDTHNLCSGPTATPADCKTGYIVTGNTQYNMESALPGNPMSDWSGYNSNTDKGYDCAICHNTNGIAKNNSWNDSGSSTFGNRSQPWTNMGWGSMLTVGTNTLTNAGGFKSEWTLDGVQCEACHGTGSNGTSNGHADGTGNQNVLAIVSSEATALNTASIPASAGSYTAALAGNIEICAKCHIRGSNTSGGKEWGAASLNRTLRNGAEMQGNVSAENRAFIKHHEQYNELVGLSTSLTDTNPAHGDGAHASLNCTSCHNPHQRAVQVVDGVAGALGITDNDQTAQERGAIVSCESCHAGKTLRKAMPGVTCIDCHMGEAVRSAPAAGMMGTWGKQADVKSHIFKISATATDIVRSASSVTDGAGVLIPVAIAKNALTVDYACGKCHDSTLAAAQGTKGLGAGVVTSLTQAQAQAYAKNIHGSRPIVNFAWTASATTSYQVAFDGSASSCPTGTCTYDFSTGGSTFATTVIATNVFSGYTGTNGVAVTLTVTEDLLSTSLTRTVFPMTVNHAPVAAGLQTAYVSTTSAYATVTNSTNNVTFTDASTDVDGDGTISNVVVKWGDGTASTATSAGATFSHNYPRAGKYTITMTVKDAGNKYSYDKAFVKIVPQTYSISGIVKNAAGTPLSGATVYLKMSGHTRAIKRSAPTTGAYAFTNVPAGAYTITTLKTGYALSSVSTGAVAANVTGLDITLTPK